MNRWSLPGPRGYFSDVAKSLRDGYSVISAIPVCGVSGLGDALRSFLSDEGWMISECCPNSEWCPLDQLYSVMGVPDSNMTRRTIPTLIAGLEVGSVIIINGIKRCQWSEWKQFLSAYEASSRSIPRLDRPMLVSIVEGVPLSEVGRDCAALRILAWQNIIGEFDVMLFALSFLREKATKQGRKIRLLARIISRLALWDLDLAYQLAMSEEKLLFEPLQILRSTAEILPPTECLDTRWESGGLMTFDDVSLQHSYILMNDQSKHEMLQRRLWEAQASDLLPLIESKRHYWAQQLRGSIRIPIRLGEQNFSDVDELEIGQLAFLASQNNLRASIRQPLDKLRRYRNKLAHLEPLDYVEAFDDDLQISIAR